MANLSTWVLLTFLNILILLQTAPPGVKGTAQNNLDVPQIRYAEVLLMYAEAQNEVSGPVQDAYDAFKRIRDRAQLTTPPLSSYNQQTFREAIWSERWHELCLRRYYLVRYGAFKKSVQ